ncbi:TPA: hypothetical protein DCW38_03400 [candidate division WOR-3 bacterium]|uniref:Uncharacterized protein n=1 Tax=candidate division WOR-3 bacterium TaxID=2052148 RepID=A0A350H9J2_UNCW3|nr:hypothetical protein [candidate division WOR-3 bacterium]
MSPNTDFKVTKDAYHLIFAYSIVQIESGVYKTDDIKILDARNLLCDVEYEFNSDNRRMYEDGGLIVVYEESINVK